MAHLPPNTGYGMFGQTRYTRPNGIKICIVLIWIAFTRKKSKLSLKSHHRWQQIQHRYEWCCIRTILWTKICVCGHVYIELRFADIPQRWKSNTDSIRDRQCCLAHKYCNSYDSYDWEGQETQNEVTYHRASEFMACSAHVYYYLSYLKCL